MKPNNTRYTFHQQTTATDDQETSFKSVMQLKWIQQKTALKNALKNGGFKGPLMQIWKAANIFAFI